MSKEDFYKILEVDESATSDDIKKSYRRLSLKLHPDRNPGDPDATRNFQKITEAYETLSNDEKRQEYNMIKNNPFFGGGHHSGQQFQDMDDLFSMFFGGIPMSGGHFQGMHSQGFPQHQQGFASHGFSQGFPPGMAGMFGGIPGGNIRIFRNGVQVNPMMEKPQPIVKTIEITMEQVLTGGKLPIEVERWVVENNNKVFENVKLYVEIFKGIDNNEIIVLKDQGNVLNDMCKGDVKIFIKVANHPKFERRGLDLIYIHNISLKDSLCGFTFELKHLNGKSYTINNKSGNIIPPNYEKIIANMGLTREQHSGSLIINFKIDFPETLKESQIAELMKIL
jgi:DnaJ family protein A protein 2